MGTKRVRIARFAIVSAEAVAWLASEDADCFFEDPAAYHSRHSNTYGGPIQMLPGVRPWWRPLAEVYAAHLTATPISNRDRSWTQVDQAALDFIHTLAAERGEDV